MTKRATPLSTPSEWRLFLYDHVLLSFERGKTQIRAERFDAKNVESLVGLFVVRKGGLPELQSLESEYKGFEKEHLLFYSPDSGYKSLFERLRDATAHGDYMIDGEDSIRFRHRFGKKGQPEYTRLFGRLKFQTLVKLVGYINHVHSKK
jgi:hypothetical protein